MTITSTVVEISWLMNVFFELHLSLPLTPMIYYDNIGATYFCVNPVFHSRIKHIAIDFHFIRDQVSKKLLCISHVHTNNQLAGSLTKAFPRKEFHRHRSKIGVYDRHSLLWGHDRM